MTNGITTIQVKKDYGIIKKMKEKSGFGWDDIEKKVMAEDAVWDAYIEVCPCHC
jgi:hypothetical protein